jgi:diacylglycerol kinase family enzyme
VEIGVLVNARAGRVRRDPALLARLAAAVPAGRLVATASAAEVAPALAGLRERGVDCLLVVGGDGSVGGTLSALLRSWPAASLPAVSFACGGTVNTIAASLGARGDPERQLAGLLADATPRIDVRRCAVEVESDTGEWRAGMIFAAGVAVRWLRMYYEDSRQGAAGAASVVARIAGSALVGGRLAARMFEATPARVEVDGAPLALARFTAMAAASVEHVGLGFRPFRTAGRDPERFHFTITDAGALRVSLELPAQRRARAPKRSCLSHHEARRVRVRFEQAQPWSVDADVFAPAIALELCASPPLRFVVP